VYMEGTGRVLRPRRIDRSSGDRPRRRARREAGRSAGRTDFMRSAKAPAISAGVAVSLSSVVRWHRYVLHHAVRIRVFARIKYLCCLAQMLDHFQR
jgi:hypothetical protein